MVDNIKNFSTFLHLENFRRKWEIKI